MASSAWALQKAIHAALVADAGVLALLGAARVYDDVPREPTFPYISYGQSSSRDWSTGSDDGHEHIVTLHVWTRRAGRKAAHEISGAIETALDQQFFNLDGHRLVSLRHEFTDFRREGDGETWRGLLRFRAMTEPNP